jgi:hypothetical protein
VPVVVSDSTYRPVQVSSYKARPGARSSTVTILRVETLAKAGATVHVRIDEVGSRSAQECPRLPPCKMLFPKAAIDKSVGRQLRTTPSVPEFEDDYEGWLEHCGGAYTI